jgi:hypothetical protein
MAQAAFYQWSDAGGVIHFTDDPDKIPVKDQKKARELHLSDEPAPRHVEPQVPPTPPAGQSENWWRQQFSALKGELQLILDGLPAKEEELTQLRRKRIIYSRGSDREAVNAMVAEISADQKKIGELQNSLDALDLKATNEGVPIAWRRGLSP